MQSHSCPLWGPHQRGQGVERGPGAAEPWCCLPRVSACPAVAGKVNVTHPQRPPAAHQTPWMEPCAVWLVTLLSLIRGIICTPSVSPGLHSLCTDHAGQTQSILNQGPQRNNHSEGCQKGTALIREPPQAKIPWLGDLGLCHLSGPHSHLDNRGVQSLKNPKPSSDRLGWDLQSQFIMSEARVGAGGDKLATASHAGVG